MKTKSSTRLTWYKVQESEHTCVLYCGRLQRSTSGSFQWVGSWFWPAGLRVLLLNWRQFECLVRKYYRRKGMHSNVLLLTSRSRWRKPQPASTGCLGWGSGRVQRWGCPHSADTERPAASRESPETAALQIFEPWSEWSTIISFGSTVKYFFKLVWICWNNVFNDLFHTNI